jgi:hypothetical protein
MSEANSNIIILSDIYNMRAEKEKELAYYEEKLKELENKLFFVRKEIQLTNFIIEIIEKEKVIDLQEYIDSKNQLPPPEA